MAPDVAAMRKVRDRLRPASTMFAVATDLYYRSGPAAAEVLRRSDTARALVRRFLGPDRRRLQGRGRAGPPPVRLAERPAKSTIASSVAELCSPELIAGGCGNPLRVPALVVDNPRAIPIIPAFLAPVVCACALDFPDF